MNTTAILERLVKARKQSGLTQGQAGRKVGLRTSSFCDIEKGRNPLTMERFLELCDLYGISPVWALTGHNPDFDPQPIIDAAGKWIITPTF